MNMFAEFSSSMYKMPIIVKIDQVVSVDWCTEKRDGVDKEFCRLHLNGGTWYAVSESFDEVKVRLGVKHARAIPSKT